MQVRSPFRAQMVHQNISAAEAPLSCAMSSEDEKDLRDLLVKGGFAHDVPLANVTILKLPNKHLRALPSALWTLTSLEELDLGNNALEAVPNALGNLTRLRLLNLMSNQLRSLPPTIGALTALQLLGLKSNVLESLPEEIGSLVSLKSLFLIDNHLTHLPASIGGLTSLRKLQAAENRLSSLPDSFSSLVSLELFRMPSNRFTALPPALFRLPNLCWFSMSANPVCPASPALPQSLPVVPLASIQLRTELGTGASGTVYDTTWQGQRVAVKLFQSHVSGDGPCVEEVRVACALEHSNLPKVHALLAANEGIVMSLIQGTPLADRPNASSFLRSRYAPKLSFSATAGQTIVLGIASALQYLHSRGICHGDVYAHNILISAPTAAPFAWLCDFGAAFAYSKNEALTVEALEVLAFGIFLEEIRQRTQLSEQQSERWAAIVRHCIDATPSRRPSFSTVVRELFAEPAVSTL